MVTFLIIVLFIGVIILDYVPSIKKKPKQKNYSGFYLTVVIFTSSILVLKSLGFNFYDTYDIINLFQSLLK